MENRVPMPVRDDDSERYWQGIDQHELLIQQCEACQKHIFYPRSLCPHCFSDQIHWVKASGRGEIYSYTVVHRSFGPFVSETPFVVALVELAEGVRMMSRVKGPRECVKIGAEVRVTFEQVDENLTLPYFEIVQDVR